MKTIETTALFTIAGGAGNATNPEPETSQNSRKQTSAIGCHRHNVIDVGGTLIDLSLYHSPPPGV